jgi:hypothetical protein
MSETTRVEHTELKVKEDKIKKKDETTTEDPDPYCCIPGGGGGGPDTKI